MNTRTYQTQLWLPLPPADLFPFFADAGNLEAITPRWLNFRVVTRLPIVMEEGVLIDYRLRVHGVPMRWRTRINAWEPPRRFVDEQLRGPYRLWVHEHTFEPQAGGTLVQEHVRYAVRLDWLVHRWLVRPEVERIFAFRERALRDRFGISKSP